MIRQSLVAFVKRKSGQREIRRSVELTAKKSALIFIRLALPFLQQFKLFTIANEYIHFHFSVSMSLQPDYEFTHFQG